MRRWVLLLLSGLAVLLLSGFGLMFISGNSVTGGTGIPLLIKSGGAAYKDFEGHSWIADTGFTGGSPVTTTAPVTNTTDPTLFQTARAGGNITYTINANSGGQFRVSELEAETTPGAVKGARVQNITLSCDGTVVAAHNNFDILNPAGPCGASTGVGRACTVTDWIQCGVQGDGSGHTITVQFVPVTGSAIVQGLAVIPVLTATLSPGMPNIPAIANCVAGVASGGTTAGQDDVVLGLTSANGNQIAAGQTVLAVHKGLNPGAPPPVTDTQFNTYGSVAGVNDAAHSSGCMDVVLALSPQAGIDDTVTFHEPGVGNINSALLCTLTNLGSVDTGTNATNGVSYRAYTGTSPPTTGAAIPSVVNDLLFGAYHVEATSPAFNGGSTDTSGGLPADISTFASNALVLIGGVTEPGTLGISTAFSRQFTPASGNYCGAIVGLSSAPPIITSIAVSCVSPIAPSTSGQCTATATLSNNSQQNITNTATWSSLQPTIATVNSSGLVTASATNTGTVTIQAAQGGVTGQTSVIVGVTTTGQFEDVFVGPFPSWTNVKTSCGAAGNGSTNDTTAIQNCINGGGETIYFPSGTYLITSTITTNRSEFRIVGQDPANTTIKWGGGNGGGPMMSFTNGGNVSILWDRIERLTWDASCGTGCASLDIIETPDMGSGLRMIDDTFKNASRYGVLLAVPGGHGQASEGTAWRDTFSNIGTAAIEEANNVSNVIDFWSFFSTYQNNGIGLDTNNTGQLSAWGNYFTGNGTDLNVPASKQFFVFDRNTSINSGRFLASGGLTTLVVIGNRVINSTNANTITVTPSNTPTLLVANQIRNSNTNAAYVSLTSAPAQLLSVNNQYSEAPGTAESIAGSGSNSVLQTGNTQNNSINVAAPSMPPPAYACNGSGGVAAGVNSAWTCPTVADLASGSSTATIQTAINNACASPNIGHLPVVHLQPGTYSITSTISIPGSNCDVQLIGDDGDSPGPGAPEFDWNGPANSPVIRVQSGSKAVIQDLLINPGNGNAYNAVAVQSADVSGSRVQAFNTHSFGGQFRYQTNGLTNTIVNSYAEQGAPNGSDVLVTGNGTANSPAVLSLWAGGGYYPENPSFATANVETAGTRVTNQGNLTAESAWWEIQNQPNYMMYRLSEQPGDSGNVELAGWNFFYQGTTATAVTPQYYEFLNGFNGTAFVGLNQTGCNPNNPYIDIANATNTTALNFGWLYGDTTSSPYYSGPTTQTGVSLFGQVQVPDCNGSGVVTQSNIGTTTAVQAAAGLKYLQQNGPTADTVLPAGVDDVRINNMYVGSHDPSHLNTGIFVCTVGSGAC